MHNSPCEHDLREPTRAAFRSWTRARSGYERPRVGNPLPKDHTASERGTNAAQSALIDQLVNTVAANQPLLIVAEDAAGTALATVVVNRFRGVVRVKPSSISNEVPVLLDDLDGVLDALRARRGVEGGSAELDAVENVLHVLQLLRERLQAVEAAITRGTRALPVVETRIGDVAARMTTTTVAVTEGQVSLQAELTWKRDW